MDMTRLKSEYITGGDSLRTLADRYDVPLGTLYGASRREGWVRERQAYRSQVTEAVKEACIREDVAAVEALHGALTTASNWAWELASQQRSRWQAAVSGEAAEAAGPGGLRGLREMLAVLKELQGLLPDPETGDGQIRVVFEGDTGGAAL